jgi:geranylgeranyl transferase type-1 subunit beta
MTIRWLVERQTDLEEPEDEAEEEVGDMSEPVPNKTTIDSSEPSLNTLHQSPDKSTCLPQFDLEPLVAGMNGRTNKVADTCYAWWVGASFHLMGQPGLYCRAALRRYLLVKTQHPALGGFGKFPGDLPDLYHSYLGLAALGLVGTEGVREVDPAMCVSKRASARLSGFWKAWSN